MLNLTDNRRLWLSTVESSKDWTRENGATRNARSGRKMPEPVFWWLIEHRLIETDCRSVLLTAKGREALDEKRWRLP